MICREWGSFARGVHHTQDTWRSRTARVGETKGIEKQTLDIEM